ncbi:MULTISPECIES: hypothetical protein [Okeania]|uniref:Uncharacterized protein n=1 Tax=Okeania hirsuta TaxID=1458930 RepID=A0A3N6P4G9_9CYAN|nr:MULTISPECIES: hypothetical protein [Okeania]NET14883.1 hypothetical protein [Okeania sp. SIO1H6]NES77993.1 hypothetical protein [Okeania sp. SIO1H4]NES89245.1 hypothetical protein [Okeania sp. SIO2B9]NET21848.1 hypothetical protein [Okeania sp. SIO1H5]NET80255.1 hypothetical protein [Okeania sp. SIO1F9]
MVINIDSGALRPVKSLLPKQSIVNITNINLEQDKIVFQFNLTILTSEVPELSLQDLQVDEHLDENKNNHNN